MTKVGERFLDKTGWYPSVSKFNRLHVDIFQFLSSLNYIYAIDFSKMIGVSRSLELQPVISQTLPVHL